MTMPTVRDRVRASLADALTRAAASGVLPALPAGLGPAAIEISRSTKPEHGDLATNLAMQLARPLGRAPRAIADAVVEALATSSTDPSSPIATAEVAGPGFINLRLSDAVLVATIDGVLAAPGAWGRLPAPVRPRHVNVEFVSANPTGPLTIGNARGAFVGDLLCRVLEAGGQLVTREYYFNDSGGQIDKLGASVLARRRGEEVPEDGYHGAYVADLAGELPDDVWTEATAAGADASRILGAWAARTVRAGIEASLARLGVQFDVWTSEGSLHDNGWVDRAIEKLRASGNVYERDGALWLRTTEHGDDKDRVLIRSNGQPTYFAADAGYLEEKFSRGFDHIIYVWGIDHHGYVARTKAAAADLGIDPARVEMLLTGWVSILRGRVVIADAKADHAEATEKVAMSKRKGNVYLLDQLLDDVGVDAARWFFASRGANLDIDIDVELARSQSSENPVYYVQYAHARIASILRKATDVGLVPATTVAGAVADPAEAALARQIVRYPEVVEDGAASESTHGVTAYATELATQFHAFYRDARVVDPDQPEVSAGRLALVDAARATLANALGLLGIGAPEAM